MNPVMYIFINKGLGMSPGKMAAQAAHAACLSMFDNVSYNVAEEEYIRIFRAWWDSGHYTKLVLELPDSERMDSAERYLNDRGFNTFMVVDEGRTEDTFFQKTAMAAQLVDKNDDKVKAAFGSFKLYTD